jgi:ATP-dependent helicase/nuclease subunit A
LANHLPVHDLLDCIYEEGDVYENYSKCCPPLIHSKVLANLEAFLKLALDTNGGRYPSLSRFIEELQILSKGSETETPDEGEVLDASDDEDHDLEVDQTAIKIMTIHAAKGLEAPFVFLMNTNYVPAEKDSSGVLIDWPTNQQAPKLMFAYQKDGLNGILQPLKDEENQIAHRENANLLYVAMTRAKQCFVASGNGKLSEKSWYALLQKGQIPVKSIEDIVSPEKNLSTAIESLPSENESTQLSFPKIPEILFKEVLQVQDEEVKAFEETDHVTNLLSKPNPDILALGTWVHWLLEQVTQQPIIGEIHTANLQKIAIGKKAPEEIITKAIPIVTQILQANHLKNFFYGEQIIAVWNELEMIGEEGDLFKIDRLVELDHELVILDYKLTIPDQNNPYYEKYQQQLKNYQALVRKLRQDKPVRALLVDQHANVKEVV